MKKALTLFVIVLSASRLLAQSKPANPKPEITPKQATIEDLIRKLPNVDVDANGNITYEGQPVKLLSDGVALLMPMDSTKAAKTTRIRMNCRDVVDESLKQILANQAVLSNGLNEIDDYGDQIPHFLIKYPASVYVSKSSYRNQVLLPAK